MISNGDNVVQTFSLTKIFRDFWHREKVAAVNDLDLEIRPQEVFGLLGPNGSGKSTTIKMILGLLYPTRGFARVFDRHPTDVAIKSRIGFLPEESYLYPFLNAHETLDYYGRLFRQPRPERRKRIDMLLDMVGLSAVAYRRIGEYSKGMQRRIGLAQALINDPDLLILDEPTSGLDPLGTRQFKDLIAELGRRGKTVLLCSHLLADVEDVCDRVAILYGGRLRAQGQVGDLLSQQELTQITTERLSDETVAEIRRILDQADASVLEVTTPRDKLESLFLRIVAEAQADRVSTGGAVGTGEVAEFLRAGAQPDAAAIIDELLTAADTAATSTTDSLEPAPVEPAFNDQVIAKLTTAAEDDTPPTEATPPTAPAESKPKPAQQADRDLIDSLLDDAKDTPREDDDA